MEESFFDLVDFVKKPAVVETFVDILLCAVPIWVAVMIGLVIGWSWRPRWTGLVFLGLRSKLRFVWTVPPGFGARRLWLAFTALSAFSVARTLWSRFRGKGKGSAQASATASAPESLTKGAVPAPSVEGSGSSIKVNTRNSEIVQNIVTENDLEHLLHFLDWNDGEMAWQSLMERATSNMRYKAWRHEPETGPITYRTRTVFEDATPELVRDFFWDDEFRPKWDPMLAYFKILEECHHTGTMIVHWIKKFPFFCSDREYIIGRRIWEVGKTYYCVTKTVPYKALQRHDKPRRVDLYFSSWVIKPVQSRKGDGQLSACEVTLVHYEDMGIPKDVAKLSVRHGMWGTVKKLHSGFRAYQHARKLEASLSKSALMARITTQISFDGSADSSEPVPGEEEERGQAEGIQRDRDHGGIDWKWVVIGGTVAVACGLHTGVIGKALLLGAGQRVARR
ncbi:hypothetical protein F0562_000439 [Nyssa sinensis]|uniref:START domain-containing protein n=1 Tax=Nyssa sinensis TaxID=561372 RepID=A0A5J5C053_9ASTE|nr:hypothetical protein F0562_000439 [Nyssa sinensis]